VAFLIVALGFVMKSVNLRLALLFQYFITLEVR
jgi:hypothetical protein